MACKSLGRFVLVQDFGRDAMSPHSQATKAVSKARLLVKRFMATFSILCVVMYLGFVAVDSWEFWHKARQNELQGSVAEYQEQMQEAVGRQSAEVKKVDAIRLGWVYTDTLNQTDCNWLFVCQARVFGPGDRGMYRGNHIAPETEPLF